MSTLINAPPYYVTVSNGGTEFVAALAITGSGLPCNHVHDEPLHHDRVVVGTTVGISLPSTMPDASSLYFPLQPEYTLTDLEVAEPTTVPCSAMSELSESCVTQSDPALFFADDRGR
ncbi:MAG TPA: hypothetical protein VGG53_01435 [Mycobacterium sp.]|uniref:hypothetical protein n=1 Tax=Mycobacterium sp. TaxID=1785 RepID=UPI002F3EE0F8